MRNTLRILTFCLVATWISVKGQPSCNIESIIGNDTTHVQAFFSLLHGDIRDLKCKAGCGLYIVNATFGDTIHSLSGISYQMFSNCIKQGVRTGDLCKITDCLLDLIDMGLKIAKGANLTIPFMDEIEWFIGVMNSLHTVQNSAKEMYIAHEQSDMLQFSNKELSPSPTIKPPENEGQEQKQSNGTSAATSLVPAFGILSISTYLMFSIIV